MEFVLGNKKNNVVRMLCKSWIARGVFVINCVWVYRYVISLKLRLFETLLIILFSGLLLLNEMLIPYRIIYSRKCMVATKLLYIIVGIITIVISMRYAADRNAAIIWLIILLDVAISIFVTTIILAVLHRGDKQSESSRVIGNIDNMEGHDFEYYCADKLRKKGFYDVQVTQGSGDFGIDVIAWKNNLKYGIQCKRYTGSVGWHAVEEARAGADYYSCDRAVVLTNNYFTKQAIEGASRIDVILWDGNWFSNL